MVRIDATRTARSGGAPLSGPFCNAPHARMSRTSAWPTRADKNARYPST